MMTSKPVIKNESIPAENNDSESSTEESLAEGIIGVKNYIPESPKKKNFLPWHRPRKQYVREVQWCQEILKMVDEVLPENNILKYLGLPGDDLLDLRYFHEQICEPKNIQLKYLGFNNSVSASSKNKTEFNISLDEVNKLRLIDPNSIVIGDDFTQIAIDDSIAWDRSKKMGPFDVINIDLCDGFGKVEPDKFIETHYNTLRKLLTLQARRSNPWLLFLTTRTGSSHIHSTVFDKLCDLYCANLNECDGFRNSSSTKFSIYDKATLNSASETGKGISDIFIIALCKWVARILVQQNPPSTLEAKNVIGYKVYPKADHQDLVSIAIKITPTFLPGTDNVGLATVENHPNSVDECAIALQVLESVYEQIDADKILDDDSELKAQMVSVTSELLEAARYDISYYADWVNTSR